jgi:hypothetical protein
MHSCSVGTKKALRQRFSFLVLGGLLVCSQIPCQAASKSASKSGCSVRATIFLGWQAEEMSNPWVKLEIVPQLGGRLIQVTIGGHDFLYINPALKGQVLPLGSGVEGDRNYGGDKIWPLPEGNQDEQHWSGSNGNLDSAPFTLEVLTHGPTCAVRLTGPVNPEIGQRYIRDISIGPDAPVISFHTAMQNMSGFPQTWSEQTITEYPTSNPSGSENFTKFWGVTSLNPNSAYPNGYHVRTGPVDNPAFQVSDGTLRVHWNDITQEVWIDSPDGWLAAVDGSSGYTMVERHEIDPFHEYPGKASIIFYSSGPPRVRQAANPSAPGQTPTLPHREGPFVECEMNSPTIKLAPGESYAMDTQWFPTRMGEDFKTTTYSGVIGTPLTATATPAGLVLAGNFGVFYAGDLVVHYYGGRSDGSTAKLISVTPTEPAQLQTTVQAPPGTTRVSVHVVDAQGVDRGLLGEVLVNPPPAPPQPRQ